MKNTMALLTLACLPLGTHTMEEEGYMGKKGIPRQDSVSNLVQQFEGQATRRKTPQTPLPPHLHPQLPGIPQYTQSPIYPSAPHQYPPAYQHPHPLYQHTQHTLPLSPLSPQSAHSARSASSPHFVYPEEPQGDWGTESQKYYQGIPHVPGEETLPELDRKALIDLRKQHKAFAALVGLTQRKAEEIIRARVTTQSKYPPKLRQWPFETKEHLEGREAHALHEEQEKTTTQARTLTHAMRKVGKDFAKL